MRLGLAGAWYGGRSLPLEARCDVPLYGGVGHGRTPSVHLSFVVKQQIPCMSACLNPFPHTRHVTVDTPAGHLLAEPAKQITSRKETVFNRHPIAMASPRTLLTLALVAAAAALGYCFQCATAGAACATCVSARMNTDGTKTVTLSTG